MEAKRLIMHPEEVIKHCDENTTDVKPTLEVTFAANTNWSKMAAAQMILAFI